ncbi:MAG: hypothetical protein LAP40_20170 [Acidobacteriia bacterium]|nr:hypothetical protein [Terriglobia bacterium]
MKRCLVLAVGLALSLAAQQPNPPKPVPAAAAAPAPAPSAAPQRPSGSQRVFVLKYADPAAMADVLRVFGVTVVANSEVHAVAVASTFPEVIASVDDAINRLDVPASAPQNIELTAYYVIGGGTASPLGTAMPKDLESISTELTATSAFKNYRLLDALSVRVRAGQGAETAGTAGTVAAGSPVIATSFRVGAATVSSDGTAVRINRLYAGVKLPVAAGGGQFSISDINFDADMDVKPGQRLVVGRTGMNRDQSLFLVLAARIAK